MNVLQLLKQNVDEREFRRIFNRLTMHERDLLVPCPNKKCHASPGRECKGLEPGIVHIGRRLKQLLKYPLKID